MAAKAAKVKIYEVSDGKERFAVGHTFGSPRDMKSHRKADKFLDAALAGRKFKGITLRVKKGGRNVRKT